MFGSMVTSIESWGRKHELSRKDFDNLVEKAAAENESNAAAYKKRVILFSLLGYAFIFLIVGLILWATGASIFYAIHAHRHSYGQGKLVILLVITSILLLYSLWVKNPKPEGIQLKRGDCPEFFKLIDELSSKLRVRIDEVLLDDQMNAYVTQIPRLGILGWPKNYLVVGYPLMVSRSPLIFKATLAHEFGHISGSHGKTGAWAYMVSNMYSQLLANLREGSPILYCVFYAFLHWYTPRFHAYSFVLRRQHEYEADQMAIDLTSAEAECLDLVSLGLYSRALSEEFWPAVNKLCYVQDKPPGDLMERMQEFLQKGIDEETAQKWYQQDLQMRTETADTHPSLMDRLLFAKFPKETAAEIYSHKLTLSSLLHPELSAARHFLGAKEKELKSQLSLNWQSAAEANWQAAHQEAIESKAVLEKLEAEISQGKELERDEQIRHASLILSIEGREKGMPLVEAVLSKYPDDWWSNMVLGTHRLEKGDESGLELVERSMSLNVARLPDACEFLVSHFKRRGRYEMAEKYSERIDQFSKEANLAINERILMPEAKNLEAHGQSAELIEPMISVLSETKVIKAAYLARRRVSYLSDVPCYVLGLQFKNDLNTDKNQEAVELLSYVLNFPYDLRIFPINSKLAKTMKELGGQVFESQK